MILTEKEVTGDVSHDLRRQAGLSQKAFWKPLGVTQSTGCRYESGDLPLPPSVRILLVAVYVCGLSIDAATPDGVEALARLASLQNVSRASQSLNKAADLINKAQAGLERI